MRYVALIGLLALSSLHAATVQTSPPDASDGWKSVTSDPQEQYVLAVEELKRLARDGDTKAVREELKQIKADFPGRAGGDLDLFINGELRFWSDRYAKALVKYERLLKDYPTSSLAPETLERQFTIAKAYLDGRKKKILGLFKYSPHDEAIEVMEGISDRAGLDDPNSIGLKAALAVAEHYEAREQYLEAYLKWSEIASYWETGVIAKRALWRMGEDNLAAYSENPPKTRHRYDASKLVTARTYYERFTALYPNEAAERKVPAKLVEIDEQLAQKEYLTGRYYLRTGKSQAANLYFDMVIQNWPDTEAAQSAREALGAGAEGGQADGT